MKTKWDKGWHRKAKEVTQKTGVPYCIIECSEGFKSIHPLFSDPEVMARTLCAALGATFIDRTFVLK